MRVPPGGGGRPSAAGVAGAAATSIGVRLTKRARTRAFSCVLRMYSQALGWVSACMLPTSTHASSRRVVK
jgi:hypothetical protein